ncbi:MAG: hypothetical protein OXJ64_07435, partial [Boseongicola sp.]|nr:hypothetical protein [Boseongicola sp.]
MPEPAVNRQPKLSVANFGPIAKASIELRPLTVFAGPSNTGKSYLAILIHALHKSCLRLPPGLDGFTYHFPFFEEIAMQSGSLAAELEVDGHRERVAQELKTLASEIADAASDNPLAEDRRVSPTPVLDRLIRTLIKDSSEFGNTLSAQIVRSFGVESANSLIRRNSRSFEVNLAGCAPPNGGSIDPIGFELAHQRSKSSFSFSIPDEPNAHI